MVGDHACELFEKERIPLRSTEHGRREGCGDLIGVHRRRQDGQAVIGAERVQRDLRGVPPVHPRRAVSRPIGGDEQDPRTRKPIDKRLEEFFRRFVDPVQIFDQQRDRLPPALEENQIAQDAERARLHRFGAEVA